MSSFLRVLVAAAMVLTACGGGSDPAEYGMGESADPANPGVPEMPDNPDVSGDMPPTPERLKAKVWAGSDLPAEVTFFAPSNPDGWLVNRFLRGEQVYWRVVFETKFLDTDLMEGEWAVDMEELVHVRYQVVPFMGREPVMNRATPMVSVTVIGEDGRVVSDPPDDNPPDTEPQYAGPGDEEAVLRMLDTVQHWTIRPVRESLDGEDLRVYHLVTTRRDNGFMATIISTTAVDASCERRYVLEVRSGILRAGGMEGCEGFGTSFGFVRFLTEANKFSSFHSTRQVPNPPYEVVPREVE